MKYLYRGLLGLFLMCFCVTNSVAQIEFENEKKYQKTLKATGFTQYPPFGYIDDPRHPSNFESLFGDILKEFAETHKYEIEFEVNDKYETLARKVRRGDIDLLFGAYFETEVYKGVELVFPAVISNPVTVIMLPHRIGEVSSVEDLRKLKGVVNTTEVFTDYVSEQLRRFNVEKVSDSDEAFEKLFTSKADYIITSYYFGVIEAARLGLKNKVSFSKQVLWEMPLFLGVSKLSTYREDLIKTLQKLFEDPKTKEAVKQNMERIVKNYEQMYMGAVPPLYSQ